ncbi:hypothetical protein GGS20DRAFT_589461 [Poronia punctata]|nr:hypothetical protein GGS20DRAFT_589461 [Poronia punctata]
MAATMENSDGSVEDTRAADGVHSMPSPLTQKETCLPTADPSTPDTSVSGRSTEQSAATLSIAESSGTTIHRDADLEVVVKSPDGKTVKYMVCAAVLACISPAWKSKLENGENRPLVIEDDAEAIRVIFHIAHHDYAKVPEEPTLDQLFELSETACRYDCTHIYYPWANQWISNVFSSFGQDHRCFPECHKAIKISWVFGDLELFRDMTDALIVSSRLDTTGNIVNICGERLEEMHLPAGLADIVANARATTLREMISAARAPIDTVSGRDEGESSTYCKVGKDGNACEMMLLGSAIPMLTKAGLFPVPAPEQYTGSINDMKNALLKVKAVPYYGKEWAPHASHDGCTLGLENVAFNCLKDMKVPLNEVTMAWMSEQATKCGVQATTELQSWRESNTAN